MKKKYPKETVNRKRRRMLSAGSVLLCMALLFILSGCGGEENEADGSAANGPGAEGGVYVPEFIPIEGEYVDYEGARVAGNNLCYFSVAWDEEIQYYVQLINILSLQERTVSSFPLAWPEGTRDFSQKITEQLRKNPEEGIRVSGMEIDGQGRIYIAGSREVWLYDEKGQYQGEVSPGDAESVKPSSGRSDAGQSDSGKTALEQISIANPAIDGVYRDGSGKIYVSYGEEGQGGYGSVLAEIYCITLNIA